MSESFLISLLPNIITSVLALIVWQVKRAVTKREKEERRAREKLEKDQKERDEKLQKVIESLAYNTQQLEVVREEYRAVKQANAEYDGQIKEIVDSMKVLKKSSLATTKKMLTEVFQLAHEKGSVSGHIKEVVSDIIVCYDELGGNSYIHSEYDAFMALPTENNT